MKLNQIGFQLYTCRDLLSDSAAIAKTFKRLRSIGYTTVETCGTSVSDEELGKIIKAEGLTCASAHQNPAAIRNTPEIVAENLNQLGCQIVAYPYPADVDFGSLESIQTLVTDLQHSGDVLRKLGKTLCYHNHQQEFRKLDGKTILEQIYKGTSLEALQGELDIYWVQYGGGDVKAMCERLKGRLPIIHLKEYHITSENVPKFCELGAGTLDIPGIITASEKSGCKWFIVEQDVCPGDPVDSLEQSFRYLESIV